MKPVEIEFLMKDSLTAGLDKSKISVEQLLGAARRASITIIGKINDQRKVIDGLNSDLVKMERNLQSIEPGAGQQRLLAEIHRCKKALSEEVAVLRQLEQEHKQSQQSVSQLEAEYKKVAMAEMRASDDGKSLNSRLTEQKATVKLLVADVRSLQKAYEKAVPGESKRAALADLTAAKQALEEEKRILSGLTEEQDKNKESNRRLSMQLRDLQNVMTRMRIDGQEGTEAYREMAEKAALLADTLGDVKRQTSILSDDDANLQGFVSGINGLSGAFTTATGVMSLFASENDDLQKVQARLQSVMAITMGLQQAYNTLNKDSAFRLVTVSKAKEVLTRATSKLSTALGISNTAAKVLMGTLTFGLSLAISGVVIALNKYASARDEAIQKAKEQAEIESRGRAEMLRTQFELDNACEKLKNFNGTKAEEKRVCDEMNRKWGESFGYYNTAAQWYDILIKKGEQYVNMLYLQAKAQALLNRASNKDTALSDFEATKPGSAETDMPWWQAAALSTIGAAGDIVVQRYNMDSYEKHKAKLEKERDAALNEAKELIKESERIARENGLGGNDVPFSGGGGSTASAKKHEEVIAKEMAALRSRNNEAELALMTEGSRKKRLQLKLDYEEEIAELVRLEGEWRKAQNGELSKDQAMVLEKAKELAKAKMSAGEGVIRRDESKEILDYLRQWGTLEEQKAAIIKKYELEIAEESSSIRKAALSRERDELLKALDFKDLQDNLDWETLFNSLERVSTKALRGLRSQLRSALDTKDITAENAKILSDKILEIDDRISERTNVLSSLLPVLKERERLTRAAAAAQDDYDRAILEQLNLESDVLRVKEDIRDLLSKLTGEDVKISEISLDGQVDLFARLGIDETSESGKRLTEMFAGLRSTMTSLGQATDNTKKALSRVESAKGLLEGSTSVGDIFDGVVESGGGGVLGIMSLVDKNAQSLAEFTDKIGLEGTGFGDAVHGFADGVSGFQGAIMSLAGGDVFGAVNGVIDGIRGFGKSISSLFGFSWSGGNEAEVAETINRLTERNELLQQSIEDLTDEMKTARGASAIDASRRARKLQEDTNANYKSIAQAQAGYHSAHHSFNYYWDDYSQEQINRLSQQIGRQWNGSLWDLSPEEMKMLRSNVDMWEQIQKTGKGGYGDRVADKLNDYIDQAGKLEEITDALSETLTGTTKDNVFDDFLNSLYELADGSEDVMDNIAENWQKMVNKMAVNNLVGAKFQKNLEDWYENLAKLNEARTNGEITNEEYRKRLEALKAEYEGYVNDAKRDIETLRTEGIIQATGENSGVTQSGKAGAFTTMSQDQGTKLEGLFVSGQMHWASMDDKLTDVSAQIGAAGDTLKKIEEHTGSSASSLDEIKNDIKIIKRDGLKVK